MATRTANTGSNNWNTAGAWVGGVQPTAADDVIIPASAVVTLPGSTTCYCRSLTVQASATLAWSNNTGVILQVGDGTAGAGNVAVSIDPAATISLLAGAGFGAIQFVSTSATQQTVATGGKTLPNIAFGAVAGSPSYLLSDALTCSGTVTLTYGTLNTNGQTCNWYGFSSSNSNTRVFTTGASTITVTGSGANVWWMPTATNMTVNASGSTINLSGTNVQFYAGFAWWDVNFTGGGPFTGSSGTSFRNLTVTGTAVKTDYFGISAYNITVSGTLTLNGNSATNRLLIQSLTGALVPSLGTPYTITAGAVSCSNVDFQDITGAGAGSWNLSAITGGSGDCGGNSGITFTTPATQTHTASAGGNWSDNTKWTSRVPLPQDDVVVDSNTSGTLTSDMPRWGKSINFTGFTGTFSVPSTIQDNSIYGGLTLASGMTFTTQSAGVFFCGRSSYTVTSNGKSWGPIAPGVRAPGGTVTLQDALTCTNQVTLDSGTLNTNGMAVTCQRMIDGPNLGRSAITRGLTLGTSTVTMSVSGTVAWAFSATSMTMSAASATLVLAPTAVWSSIALTGGGFTYGTVTYTGSAFGPLTITGANTITTLNVAGGRQLILPSATTTTVTNWNVNGSAYGYVYLPGLGSERLTAPDSAALSITGDLDIRVRVALDKWSGMTNNATLVDKVDFAANSSYSLAVLSDGRMFAYISHTGAGVPESAISTVNLSATADGATLWVRMTYRASDGRVQFFTASGALATPVAADFTQLGANTATATSGAIYDGTTALGLGDISTGSPYPMKGKLYRAQVRNGLDGTLAFDADLTTKAVGANTFTESSANAATVTVVGALARCGDGRVMVNSSTGASAATVSKASGAALSDYVQLQDITATGGASFAAGAFGRNVSGNTGWVFGVTANMGVTGNWNANGTWYGGVQPTAADNVYIPPTSTVTIPSATTALGRSLSEYGTLVFASTTAVLNLGDATAGGGNRGLFIPQTVVTEYVTNPGFVTDTAGYGDLSGWFVNAGATITRDTTTGVNAGKVVTDGALLYEGKIIALGTLPAGTYTFTIRLRGNAGGESVQICAGQGNNSWGTSNPTLTTAWTSYTVSFTTDGTAACWAGVRSLSTPTMTWYMTELHVTAGSTSVPAFSGASTSDVDYTYAWTGAANASTSTRTLNRPAAITLTGVGQINFVSTSATQQAITTGGKTLPNYNVNGTGSSYLLADANTSSGTVTLTRGTLNTSGQACSWAALSSSNGNTRTLTLGASAIATNSVDAGTNTNLTVTANTAVLTMASSPVFNMGGMNTNGLSLVITTSGDVGTIQGGSHTFANLTRTGTAAKTDGLILYASQTVTGTLTLTGNSATNRLLVHATTVGTAVTITAAVVSLSNVDFMDITGAGAAAPFTGTSIGDCGGLSGITPTTPATQTHTASAGGSWSDASKWTSRVPLPQDDVIVNASTTGTLTADMPRLGKSIDFTGFAGTFVNSTTSCALYGSLTIASGMTWTIGTAGYEFRGRGSYTFTSNGKYANSWSLIAPGGTLTLGDAFVGTTHTIAVYNGTLNTAGFAVTCGRLVDSGTATRGMTFGTSTVNLTNTTATSNFSVVSTGMTMSAASATFVISAASANARTFVGAGFSYGTLRYTVASSPGSLTITGANTFGTLDIGPGRPLILPSSTTTTVTNMNAAGVPNGYTYLPGTTTNYLSSPDSAALSITGDIDIRVRVALNDWTPAVNTVLLAKEYGAQSSYSLRILSTGKMCGEFSPDGNAPTSIQSSVNPTVVDGTAYWCRVTYRASDGRVQFFTASGALTNPSAGDFTQVGTDRTNPTTGAIFDSTSEVALGAYSGGGSQMLAGKLYRAQIRSNILDDGTGIVFDADLTTKTCGARTFTESSTNAATVTINGASAQAGDGSVNISSSTPGTPATLSKASGSVVADFLSVSDSTATGGAIFFARASGINAGGNTGWVFGTSPKQGASNWNVDSTWSKGVQPTAADWVVIPSGANVTIPGSVTALARSLRVLAGGTLSYASAPGSVLTLGDATADLFNEAVAISASATINAAAGYGLLGFASTSGTVQTIESGGKTLPGLTFNGAGSSYRLSDASVSNGTVTLLRGTFDTNSMACSWDAFTTTGALVRSLLLGTSQVTVASAGTAWHAALTGLTLVAGGSTITVSHAESPTFSGGGATYGTVVFAEAGTPVIAGAGTTFANLTRTGTPVQTDALALAADIVVTGTLGLTGQSIVNRILFCSDTLGVQRRVTAALVVAVNADFRDINADGAFLWDLTAALGGAGDLGNNTGILFVLVGPRVQVGGNPFDVANLAIPDSRVAWSQLSTAGVAEVAVCGWHGTRFAPEVGAYAIVSSTGPLADLVGELVRVQAGSNDVFVYVYSDGDVAEDISLTRRAFMELAELWTEELPVKVTVIAGASQ